MTGIKTGGNTGGTYYGHSWRDATEQTSWNFSGVSYPSPSYSMGGGGDQQPLQRWTGLNFFEEYERFGLTGRLAIPERFTVRMQIPIAIPEVFKRRLYAPIAVPDDPVTLTLRSKIIVRSIENIMINLRSGIITHDVETKSIGSALLRPEVVAKSIYSILIKPEHDVPEIKLKSVFIKPEDVQIKGVFMPPSEAVRALNAELKKLRKVLKLLAAYTVADD